MEPSSKKQKIKSLQTLSAETLIKQLNPIYHPLLLTTLLNDLNLANHLQKIMANLQKEQQEIIAILATQVKTNGMSPLPDTVTCEQCGNEDVHVRYDDFCYGDEITAPGTVLLKGTTGKTLIKKLKRSNDMIKILENWFMSKK